MRNPGKYSYPYPYTTNNTTKTFDNLKLKPSNHPNIFYTVRVSKFQALLSPIEVRHISTIHDQPKLCFIIAYLPV